jgi:WD40 repeat protein
MIEWDIATRRSANIFTDAHSDSILQIHALLDSNGKHLCSQGREGDLKCWDLETRKLLHAIHFITPFETKQLSFCKFSLMGSIAALPHSKNVVVLHQVNQNESKHIGIIDPDNKIKDGPANRGMLMSLMLYQQDGNNFLLCGMENGQILQYDLRNTEEPLRAYLPPRLKHEKEDSLFEDIESFPTVGDPVLSLNVHDNKFISGTTGNTISVGSLSDDTILKQYSLRNAGISDIATVDNHSDKIISRIMCTAGWDHRVRIFDLKRHKPLAIYKYHTQTVNCVDIQIVSTSLQDGYFLASGSKDNRIALWPLQFKEKTKT